MILRRLGDPLRYESALDRVVGRGKSAELWIHPTNARELHGSSNLVVHLIDQPWTLCGVDPRAISDDTLALNLEQLRIRERPKRARRPLLPDWTLILTAPSGVGDLHVLPVADIGSQICVVRSPESLPIGFELHGVEIVGDTGVIRRGSAVVLESIPWTTPLGNREFRLRLLMEPSSVALDPTYDTIDDPSRIRRILELTSLLDCQGEIDGGGGFRLLGVDDQQLILQCELPQIGTSRRTLAFDLFAVRYECEVRVIGHDRATRTSLPLFLRRRRRRAETRVAIRRDDVAVRYHNPATGTTDERRVLDISQGGLRFEPEPGDVLWPDLVLGDARLICESDTHLGQLGIRAASETDCHAAYLDPRVGHQESIARLLTSLRQPDLTIHDGKTFREQLALYRSMGLLMPYMEKQLRASPGAGEAWRRSHERGDVCRTLARYEGGEAVASVTALMGWDNVWLGQHLAARPGRSGCTPGTLLLAFLDHVLLRPDCRWMAFFATRGNDRMNGIHERFAEMTGTPDAMARHAISGWLLSPSSKSPPLAGDHKVRSAKKRDQILIHRASTRQMGELVATGLGLTASGLDLREVRRRFRRSGLRRERVTRIVSDKIPRVATITERTSPGLCIPGILNGTWVIPLHLDVDPDGRRPQRQAIDHAVADLELEADEPNRLVFFDESVPRSWLEALGLVHSFDAYVYVLNRAGLRRYATYLAESYGELNARRATSEAARVVS